MKKLLLTVLSITLLLHGVAKVSALDIAIEPWFSHQVSVDPTSLPPSVQAIPEPDFYHEGGPIYDVRLVNISDIPYILVAPNTLSPQGNYLKPEYVANSGVPNEYFPIVKLQNSKVYNWHGSSTFNEDTRVYDNHFEWRERTTSQYPYDFSVRQAFYASQIELAENPIQDNRPSDVQPPADQEFVIDAFYMGAPAPLRGKITYSLSPNYDPNGVAKAGEMSEEWQQAIQSNQQVPSWVQWAARIGIAALFAAVIGVTLRLRKGKTKTKKKKKKS